ncbi:acetyl-CoA C-acetyltransferase [Thiosocius teredinicola]|uniref:acetyl-CoA C-acetyltransferase n=1 Tax=Thiosocius teredinicola TaxID=1973002 RepID=UPI000990E829
MSDADIKPDGGRLKGRAVYVVDGTRTPFLKARGRQGPFTASDLALAAGRALLNRCGITPEQLDQLILGCVSSGVDEANIGRVVALRLGCSEKMPAWTVQRNCASGMQSIESAALDIATGRSDLVMAGGTEAMSHHPVMLNSLMVNWLGAWSQARSLGARGRALMQLRMQHFKPVIALLRGLTDPVVGLSMGQTAEELAERFGIDRTMMDGYAVRSHLRLAKAFDDGHMNEIEPLYDADGNVYEQDDGVRADSSVEALAKLRPVFDRPVGRVTAGNSAQVSDGAAMLLLASEGAVERHDLPVLGRIVDSEWAGLDPAQMGLGPVHAMAPIMQRQDLQTEDIGTWEINEAFAAQVLACCRAWSSDDYAQQQMHLPAAFAPIDEERLNVDGGGISLGHPVGASGARITLHALKVMQRNQQRLGMASLCIGGGQGGALLLENTTLGAGA